MLIVFTLYFFGKPKKVLFQQKSESSLIEVEICCSRFSAACKLHTYRGAKMRMYAGRSLDRNICKYHCLLSFLLTTANTDWVTITRFQRKAQPRLWADDQAGDISNSCPPFGEQTLAIDGSNNSDLNNRENVSTNQLIRSLAGEAVTCCFNGLSWAPGSTILPFP